MVILPRMLLIGSAGRNTGKTELACSILRRFCGQHDIIGIKVTPIREAEGVCPRGVKSCRVCSSFTGIYCITEESPANAHGRSADTEKESKDTTRLKAAGAARVFWLRVRETHLEEGFAALLHTIGKEAISVCESNSLRRVVEPGLFLMLRSAKSLRFKPSAKAVKEFADRIVAFDGHIFDLSLDDISLTPSGWAIKSRATAIILAGGSSTRMGRDKSLLPVRGRPLLQRLCEQLRPHFAEIVISTNDVRKHRFQGVKIVADRVPGQGPLMGIVSAMQASTRDVNFVTACDIAEINIPFVRRLLREVQDCDGVVPISSPSHYEPLFAVYRKSMLPAFESVLASGGRRIIFAYPLSKIKYIELEQATWLRNINTPEDYEKLRQT